MKYSLYIAFHSFIPLLNFGKTPVPGIALGPKDAEIRM